MSVMRTAPSVTASISSATTTKLVPGETGKIIRVWKFALQNTHATTDCSITLKSGTTALSGVHLLTAAGGSFALPYDGMSWYDTAQGEDLNLTTSAGGTIVGHVKYTVEQA
jgi:hypothetical protein